MGKKKKLKTYDLGKPRHHHRKYLTLSEGFESLLNIPISQQLLERALAWHKKKVKNITVVMSRRHFIDALTELGFS